MKTFTDPEAFSRVKRLPLYVFTITDKLRDEAIARGVDVIDLSMGNPDKGAPPRVVEALKKASNEPKYHRYMNPRGLPELRRAAAGWYARRRGVTLDPDREVCATIGSKEGIGHAMIALLGAGDTILAPSPTYPIHAFGAIMAGGETIPVPVGPGVDFMQSLVAATEGAEKRPRGLIVNFPANPTAAVATPQLFKDIVRFAEARDLFIISDQAYCELVFDGGESPSMLQIPGARERTIEFISCSKSYGMAGWRVGIAAGNAALIAAMARVKSYLDYGLFGAVQVAATVAFNECDDAIVENRERYQRRRDALVRSFAAVGWNVPVPAASMFAWTPLPDAAKHLGSLEFCKRLIEDAGVCVAPGVGFGPAGEGFVRIALIEDEARIEAAAERIGRMLEKMTKEPKPSHTPIPRSA